MAGPVPPPETMQRARARAREIAAQDHRFEVGDESLPQGRNNHILPGRWRGEPCVLKFFDDAINKPDAHQRKAIEAFALRHFGRLAEVPALHAEFADALILARIPGDTFEHRVAALPREEADRRFLDAVGDQIGALFARMAACPLETAAADEFRIRFEDGDAPLARIERIVAQARPLCTAAGPFADCDDTLNLILAESARIATEPPRLFRHDNNFANLIVQGDRLAGLVDFEQVFLGTESLLLGALLDTVPEIYPMFPRRPAWPAVRKGYEEARGRVITPEESRGAVAMAMLNHWHRILETLSVRGSLDAWVDRFRARFPVLRALHQAAS